MEKRRIEEVYKEVYASTTFKRIADTYSLYDKKTLDMGCGYGAYMQRFGSGSVGVTTTQHEVEYGKEIGKNIIFGNVELLDKALQENNTFEVFWANNLFEHLLSPHAFLVHLKKFAKSDALLILGVPVVPKISNLMRIRKFSGSLASPHINFFTKETLMLTAQRAGWDVLEMRSFAFPSKHLDHATHMLMPHLYLVAKNNADYEYPPKKVAEWKDDPHYQSLIQAM
ncbi:class I SAM-dependent methyltransferase [Candidatus Pacebacteria bacterium]|nr:class I SAM-dependent methyltransferase [Candidatus Paceibacterota bacterium]